MDLTLVVRERSTVIPEMAITQVLTNSQAMVFAVDARAWRRCGRSGRGCG